MFTLRSHDTLTALLNDSHAANDVTFDGLVALELSKSRPLWQQG